MTATFSLVEPESLAEASRVLMELGPQARCYAGGVRLLLDMREGRASPEVLVNLKRIPELASVDWDGDRLRVGACVTQSLAAAACDAHPGLAVVSDMIAEIGNVRVRNMATLGGNLAVADPHADPATALMLLDAEIEVFGASGVRLVPLSSFQVGPFATAMQDGELIAAIHIRPVPEGWSATYHRVQRLLPPTLTVGVAVEVQDDGLERVRLAIGSVSPVAVRLTQLEDELRGLAREDAAALIESRASYIDEMTTPTTDLWGSAAYKSHISRTLLRRALSEAVIAAEEDPPR